MIRSEQIARLVTSKNKEVVAWDCGQQYVHDDVPNNHIIKRIFLQDKVYTIVFLNITTIQLN
jgi:hypothetical protein